MPYQQAVFACGEFYHIFNRGVEKRTVFLDRRDYLRFVATLNYYRFDDLPARFSFKNRQVLTKRRPSGKPLVEIVCYCLMPTHFHLLIRQLEDGGITKFLSKLTNSYTKYFNTKHKRVGPLFQGSFKAVRIEDTDQLNHTSRYIHLNPLIDYLVKNLPSYEYSSYPEYLGERGGFCQTHFILNSFKSSVDYGQFVADQESYGRDIKNMKKLLLEKE